MTTTPETRRVRFAEVSMQFNDSIPQMEHDSRLIFGRGYDVVLGTEADRGKPLNRILSETARRQGYHFRSKRSEWVAVRRDFAKGGILDSGWVPVIESSEGQGVHSDRGIAWVRFDTHDLGQMTAGAWHFLTDGRKPGDPNYPLNRRFSQAICGWVEKHGAGTDLVVGGGDHNALDREDDTPPCMTSSWEALGVFPGTGHGNIDRILHSNRDGRFEWVAARAVPDSRLQLFTDHFLIEAEAEVRLLRAAR